MRQRKVKNIDEKLNEVSSFSIKDLQAQKGNWSKYFGNDNPIYLELGCGKGKFILTHAASNPGINYIGIEGQESIVLRALERLMQMDLANARFAKTFIQEIRDCFAENEIDGLYLNFSDPWPKERHAKRRLTHRARLESYKRILKKGAFIEIKTDNDNLFDFTLEEIGYCDLQMVVCSRNLHCLDNIEMADQTYEIGSKERQTAREIMTEYEEKFHAAGKNINYIKIII